MEGVGARLGRSSTRYGPATVFTGPVRKWKKKWIHVKPPNTTDKNKSNANNTKNNNEASSHNHLLVYKWTPIIHNHNSNADDEPPRRKMKYIPVAVLEELNNEAEEAQAEEFEPIETDPHAPAEAPSSSKNEKPDINDAPMEDNQVSEGEKNNNINVESRDLNKSSVGLCLNLNDCDGDGDGDEDENEESEEAKDQTKDDDDDDIHQIE